MRHYLGIFLLLALFSGTLTGQVKLGSLLYLLSSAQKDTNKVILLYDISKQYNRRDAALQKEYAEEALQLSQVLDYPTGMVESKIQLGYYYYHTADYEMAMKNAIEADQTAGETGNADLLMQTQSLIAIILEKQNRMEESLVYKQKYLELAEQMNNTSAIAFGHNNLGVYFFKIGDYEKALDYYEKALAYKMKLGNKSALAKTYNNLGNVYSTIEGHIEFRHLRPKVMESYNAAIGLYDEIGDSLGLSNTYFNKAIVTKFKGEYEQAIALLNYGIGIANKNGYKDFLMDAYEELADINTRQENYKSANSNLIKHARFKDELFDEKTAKQVSELQIKYETEKKEKELIVERLENEKNKAIIQKRTALIFLLVAGLGVMGLIFFLVWKSNRQKQQLQQQKLVSLQKEQEAENLRAMINGEEQERKRIARELHDGLGSLLATVKIGYNALQNDVREIAKLESYQKTDRLLEDACQEVSHISHNMIPGVLVRFGLQQALSDLCEAINQKETISVVFIPHGLEKKIGPRIGLSSYRIVQELLKNAVHHSGAEKIIVQVTREEDWLQLIVEDDGKGFIVEQAFEKGRIGLGSVRSRAVYLNGSLEIGSKIEEGSTFTIEIPLVNENGI